MPKFSASLYTLFTELALLDRFRAARDAGFAMVEVQFPYECEPDELIAARDDAGVEVLLVNTPLGDPAKGELGLGALPGREAEFREGVALAGRYAEALGARLMHVLSGVPDADSDADACLERLAENLSWAGAELEPKGIGVLVEPINDRDRPGYFVSSTDRALAAIAKAGRSNVGLLCDVYHLAMMDEDLVPTIARCKETIGHVQFADAPGRHEPGTGEIDLARVFRALEAMGYDGWIGAEYVPSGRTEDSFEWFAPYREALS